MNRRAFIGSLAGGLLAAPLAAGAQQAGKIPRIGYISPAASRNAIDEVFFKTLQDLGYVEGVSLRIEGRCTGARVDQFRQAATELVRSKVDLITVWSPNGELAVKSATNEIPIVFIAVGGSPVELGLVASWARPGGNVTGLSASSPESDAKRLELIKELLPRASRVWWLRGEVDAAGTSELLEQSAKAVGIRLRREFVGNPEDLDRALTAVEVARPDALAVTGGFVYANRARIIDFAAKNRLPTLYLFRDYVEMGGLVSFGPSLVDLARRAAFYVDKILKGAKPADLPVEQPTKFELINNLKTAKALGLTIPQPLLLRADEVIQ